MGAGAHTAAVAVAEGQAVSASPELPTEIVIEDVTDATPPPESSEVVEPEPVPAQIAAGLVEENCLATLEITMADGEKIETPTLDLCHVSIVGIGESPASPLPLETTGLPD